MSELIPTVPLDEYFEMRPVLRYVRVMERVMDAIDDDPKLRVFYDDIRQIYDGILREELAPHALALAHALAEVEDAHPQLREMDGLT